MPSKYQILADTLRSGIRTGRYRAAEPLPTEFALTQQFDCSRQTVRKALEQLVKEGLIEKRQGSGSYIREPLQPLTAMRSIAVVTTYIGDYIFPGLLREIETVFSHNSCTPLLFATQNQISNERRVLETLLSLPHLDGVLVEGTKTGLPNPNLDLYRQLIRSGIPLVFMNGSYPDLPGVTSVLDDNYGGGKMLAEYLYRKGHRRIGGIFKIDDIQGLQRYAGFSDALRDLGLPPDDPSVCWYSTREKEDFLRTGRIPASMERAMRDCSALVCYNDEIAGGLIRILASRGIRIPRELAIVSFDNSRYSELSPVRITSLSHGTQNVGRLAAEIMVRTLAGIPCTSQVVPWILEEKASS